MTAISIDAFWFSVTRVQMIKQEKSVGTATGFFYKNDGQQFLITNRHVVRYEQKGIHPDSLKIRVHLDPSDSTRNDELTVKLYDDKGNSLWLEHPKFGAKIDTAAHPHKIPARAMAHDANRLGRLPRNIPLL